MPFISLSARKKRGRSSWTLLPSRKVRLVDHANFDGAASGHEGIKARFRRGGSRVMSLLSMSKDDHREGDLAYNRLSTTCGSPDPNEISSTIIRSRNENSRRHSSSVPGLTHRLSHKFSSTFGHPTVVHRTSLRSRPSVRSIQEGQEANLPPDPTSANDMSAASTYNSCSGSSPVQVSTNPTSGGISASPMRTTGRNAPFIDGTRMLIFTRASSTSKLAPITESPTIVVPSIVTVEATATAKIFFETHFKNVLCSYIPRCQRRKDLENALELRNWPRGKQNRARTAFLRQENEFLRHDRVLKSKANAMKAATHVSIAGYEIVKVLGKGSFGVVRLVKDKPNPQTEGSPVTPLEPIKGQHETYLASHESIAKSLIPRLASRRKDITKLRKEVYAMKVIRKADMLRNSQEGHLRAERDFLVASENSRWVVPLVSAFQDNKNLYLVMDYCVGGDFLGLLIRKNVLSEDVTRWYVAEMILCVEEAHNLQWIHRDVKPDNFLIGANGHLKISDFGLAFDGHWSHDQAYFHRHRHSLIDKIGIELHGDERDKAESESIQASQSLGQAMTGQDNSRDEKRARDEPPEHLPVVDWREQHQRRKLAKSVVGTSQYMAPEVIRGELYDGRCDWWSIGIILYECLFGFTPFACETRQDTKLKIVKHMSTLHFPDDKYGYQPITSEALDLMKLLLREKEERLSSPKYYLNDYAYSRTQDCNTFHLHGPANKSSKNYQGRHVYSDDADDIKAHPWFKHTDWAQIHRKQPPFVPKIKSWEDTKYFEGDESVSDLESSSSDEEVIDVPGKENLLEGRVDQGPHVVDNAATAAADVDRQINGHQHEDQHINPSHPANVDGLAGHQPRNLLSFNQPDRFSDTKAPSPLLPQNGAAAQQVDGGVGTLQAQAEEMQLQRPKKDKKRPRDKILRDPLTAKLALNMRRNGAFLGYAYRRPKDVQRLLERVEDEVEAERLEKMVNGVNVGELGSDSDGRRDSGIAGVDLALPEFCIGVGRRRAIDPQGGRRGTPSLGQEIPVENALNAGIELGP